MQLYPKNKQSELEPEFRLHYLHTFWSLFLPAVIAIAGMFLTFQVHQSVISRQDAIELDGFDQMMDDTMVKLQVELDSYFGLLMNLRGLFDASTEVTRVDFDRYLTSLDFANRFPGNESIAWYPRVPDENLADFERSVSLDDTLHAGGYPAFKIRPPSNHHEHFVLNYLYAESDKSGLMGFDMSANSVRLRDVHRARDTGKVVMTAPLNLMMVDGAPKGFLLMVPVYSSLHPATLDERRKGLTGVLVGAFRFDQLIQATDQRNFTAFQVYDRLLSQSDPASPVYLGGAFTPDAQKIIRMLDVDNRRWEVHAYQSADLLNRGSDSRVGRTILVMGFIGSMVSALLLWTLITSRNRAVDLARSLTEDLSQANENLLRSNRDLTQFAYVASHDLQTPVRNIDSIITMLDGELQNDENESARRYLDFLRQSSGRMQRLVSDLLDYARIDRVTVDQELVDLNLLMRSIEVSLTMDNADTDLTISCESLPLIMGNADQLERLFMNLVSNAIKYRHPDRSPQIKISAIASNEQTVIFIEDNGLGIDENSHDRIFEPFHRLHSYDSIKGTGLGLSICRQIMSTHDGSIRIESSDDSGTVFVLTFAQYAQLQKAA